MTLTSNLLVLVELNRPFLLALLRSWLLHAIHSLFALYLREASQFTGKELIMVSICEKLLGWRTKYS